MIEIKVLLTEDEISEEREEAIRELPERCGQTLEDIKNRYQNGYGYREALHTSWIFHENVNMYLAEHPCVILDEEAYRIVRLASELLFELYQRIGRLGVLCEEEDGA